MDIAFAPRQIEFWPIEHLRPYVRNAKVHGTDQVARIAASMARFGWTAPCMVGDDGELWWLGNHRLICGDSTSTNVVAKLLGDVRPPLIVTHQSYGVEYDPAWRNQTGAAKTFNDLTANRC